MDEQNTQRDRVQKIIAESGYCSRRKAEELIEQGRVAVNNKRITIGDKAQRTDTITINGKRIILPDKRYYKFYKPMHCLTTLSDPSEKKTILPYISRIRERVYPVGRLDYDTEGLLFLTNDGDFANQIMHPRYEHTKQYHVQLDKPLTPEVIQSLKSPVELDDGPVTIDSFSQENETSLTVTIHVGKNRIIRRVFEGLGYQVAHLKRIAIDSITLDNLKPGEYKELTEREISSLVRH